ncbi:YolD-like family protein [Pontibacillus yanchengensis]|uniref:YolD-like family protein n=2 Tax=Pontibacillus yanchengensis TaxID=462910 RepID=A0ACC7VAR1_9BACI|nr:YolD-like family protein [Pontibacillus yanchengensis]MYL32825.1 YolD-like family protein [Pontibacillus yanchengensis]MYL51737.1 YolD-like family protein [Pontibacillus yanchengensis]
MTLRDRGNIKWTSLMLPEHVQILKDMWKEDDLQTAPELDEQALQQLNETIQSAYEEQLTIILHIFSDGSFHEYTGRIEQLLPHDQRVKFRTSKGQLHLFPIHSIVNVA